MKTLEKRKRDWLRDTFADAAGSGSYPDESDYEALPVAHRSTARAIARRCVLMFMNGDQGDARETARTAFDDLLGQLPDDWKPPAPPDPGELAGQVGSSRLGAVGKAR